LDFLRLGRSVASPEGVFPEIESTIRALTGILRASSANMHTTKRLITLPEAVRRLSALPATNLGLDHRGFVQDGMFADVVVFLPQHCGPGDVRQTAPVRPSE